MSEKLTHLDSAGQARMVDIGDKSVSTRTASAEGRVRMQAATLALALAGDAKKGDVRATAQLAGIMAAKRTSELIPLCHLLALNLVEVDITPDETLPGFVVHARVRTDARTGVEMEALTAVSVACLTIFDMLKAADRAMSIDAVRVTEKTGGASGDYRNSSC
jgi:cyclic pyranopterin monophosphate synthase